MPYPAMGIMTLWIMGAVMIEQLFSFCFSMGVSESKNEVVNIPMVSRHSLFPLSREVNKHLKERSRRRCLFDQYNYKILIPWTETN